MDEIAAELARIHPQLDKRYMSIKKATTIQRVIEGSAPIKAILEIGIYAGTGTALLATILKKSDGHIWSVDLPWTSKPNKNFQITARERLDSLSITNATLIYREDGAEGFLLDFLSKKLDDDKLPNLFDVVYIDGGHTWMHCSSQFVAALAATRRGGWIIFDDIANLKWPEVGKVWDLLVRRLVPPDHRFELNGLGFVLAGKTRPAN